MVEIGEKPILWHIMKHYSYYCCNEFFIALGYKGDEIKKYFIDYHPLSGDMKINLKNGHVEIMNGAEEEWVAHLIDTGLTTNTGGRLRRLKEWIGTETFMLTYGDGVSSVDIQDLLRFHKDKGLIATVTAVRPPARFGGLDIAGDIVEQFEEKSQIREGWINGGYFVFEPEVFQYITGDDTVLEAETLAALAKERQLAAYRHEDFWQCMDTLRDKRYLEDLWKQETPPWRIWE
jgi:glucose-1-phosphate cytidylyltransferase